MKNDPIWKTSKDEADNNLQVKITILRGFASKGIPWKENYNGEFVRDPSTGARVLDFYPSNSTAFAKWSLDTEKNIKYQNCESVKEKLKEEYGYFKSHGPDSLKKRKSTETKVKGLFKALKATAKEQYDTEDHAGLLKENKSKLSRWQVVAEQEGAFVIDALEAKGKLQKKVTKLERALSQSRLLMKSMTETKEVEIAAKDNEIAELKKQLTEIKRFRPAGD